MKSGPCGLANIWSDVTGTSQSITFSRVRTKDGWAMVAKLKIQPRPKKKEVIKVPTTLCSEIENIINEAKTQTDFSSVDLCIPYGALEFLLFGAIAQSEAPGGYYYFGYPSDNGFDTMHIYFDDDEINNFISLDLIHQFVLAFYNDPTLRNAPGGIYANNNYPLFSSTPLPLDLHSGSINVYSFLYGSELPYNSIITSFSITSVNCISLIKGINYPQKYY